MAKIDTEQRVTLIARRLYEQMPDARMPATDPEGFRYWGEVEGTQQWAFCEAIAREISEAASNAIAAVAAVAAVERAE
jgi:hypothetical protein